MTIPVSTLQKALKSATGTLQIAAEYNTPTPAVIFTPPSHVRALRLQTMLVVGARGTGKTFWTQALQQDPIRKMLERDVPELNGVRVSVGYTNSNYPDAYPSSQIFSALLKDYGAIDIWRTVLLHAVASQPETKSLCPFKFQSWKDDVDAVAASPELCDRFLYDANEILATAGVRVLVLFDALDRVAESWQDIDTLTTSLLRAMLQLSTYSQIKTKVFLREDHFHRVNFSFPDASKLRATSVALSWNRAELYGLLWKHLCNTDGQSGEILRSIFEARQPGRLVEKDGVWFFSPSVALTDVTFRPLFEDLAGPYMGKDRRRGIPYIWTVGHLADARQQTSPRSFLAAIRQACDDSCDQFPDAQYAIHYESIKRGVQSASKIRVNEMQEDNPWANGLMTLLRGMTVPCSFQEVQAVWEKEYPKGPGMLVDKFPHYTPPEFAQQLWQEVRTKLDQLGFCMTLQDGRFNMPDLYRVGFGLGRKGGVKPLP